MAIVNTMSEEPQTQPEWSNLSIERAPHHDITSSPRPHGGEHHGADRRRTRHHYDDRHLTDR
jgi:hypothetical protein